MAIGFSAGLNSGLPLPSTSGTRQRRYSSTRLAASSDDSRSSLPSEGPVSLLQFDLHAVAVLPKQGSIVAPEQLDLLKS